MTREEFDNHRWGAGLQCYIDGELYDVVKVDFECYTVGILDDDGETILDIPCKFVTIKQWLYNE